MLSVFSDLALIFVSSGISVGVFFFVFSIGFRKEISILLRLIQERIVDDV